MGRARKGSLKWKLKEKFESLDSKCNTINRLESNRFNKNRINIGSPSLFERSTWDSSIQVTIKSDCMLYEKMYNIDNFVTKLFLKGM
jgi:hypothetical protein